MKILRSKQSQRDRTISGSRVSTSESLHKKPGEELADNIMRIPETNNIIRKRDHFEETRIQQKPLTSFIQKKALAQRPASLDDLTNKVNSNKYNGNRMDASTKSFMESRFGSEFSEVKIHTDKDAVQMNRDLNAKAFTVGNNIYFNEGQYQPGSNSGKHLLAHELAHTIQQHRQTQKKVQRLPVFHGSATGAPSNWSSQVAAANTPALKAALIQSVLGSSVTVNDVTAQSSKDATPDPAHLLPYTASSPTVNFDNDLQSKSAKVGGRSLSPDAGYTLFQNKKNYVILSAKVIDSSNYYSTIYTLNHELDHVRQNIAGSSLKGNSSELDAWTSSFIREFSRSYIIQENANGTCQIYKSQQYVPLLGYYEASGVSTADKATAVQRIKTHYTSVIQPHAGHLAAFRFWLRRSLDQTTHVLADDLIAALQLQITASQPSKSYSQFSCSNIPSLTYQPAATVSLPVFPGQSSGSPGVHNP